MLTAYYCVGSIIVLVQILGALLVFTNSRYALGKYRRDRSWYQPKTVLIVPCKGLDLNFEANIKSFFDQKFDNYLLWFVVESEQDAAYGRLCKLRDRFAAESKAIEIKILTADVSQSCSRKIHNLLYCCKRVPNDIEVMAFADSDICVRQDWLSHLVYPLHQEKNGVASSG